MHFHNKSAATADAINTQNIKTAKNRNYQQRQNNKKKLFGTDKRKCLNNLQV